MSRLSLYMLTSDQVHTPGIRRAALAGQLRQVLPGEPGFITRLVISIQAADIAGIREEFFLTADEQQTVTRDLSVPLGTNRRLTVSAFNASGNEIFRSEEIVLDLTQEQQTVSITLMRVLVPISATPASLERRVFRFAAGAPVFGIPTALGPIRLAFGGFEGPQGSFALTAGRFTATGEATIASCTLNVIESTFPPGEGPQRAERIRFDPCQVDSVDGRMIAVLADNPTVSTTSGPPAAENTVPLAGPDTGTTAEDTPLRLDVLANDSDVDGDQLTVVAVTQSSHGTVMIEARNAVIYVPAANFNGTDVFTYTLSDGNGGAATATVTVTVTAVNDAPSFTVGPNQTVLEDAGAQSVAGWATAIQAGPADEAGQLLSFVVTANTNPALFNTPPAIAPDGTLTYTPAANAHGVATITVQLQDDGGTAHGGSDTSPPQSFTITVTAVNDAPSFMAGPDQTVLEDAGAQSVAGWATAIQAGPADEAGQRLSFVVTANTNPALFSTPPAIAPDGTLTYTPAANAHGVATITVQLQDDGGTAHGGSDTSPPQSFTITVTAVNDAPSFMAGPDQTVLEDAGAQSVAGWATAIQAGPADEAGQRLSFVVTANTNPALFSALPAISPDGTLTYTPAANAHGVATITVQLQDDGGTAHGGSDTSPPQSFTITVTAVNDAPSFTAGPNQTVLEDAGAQSVAGWATAIQAGPADEAGQLLSFVVTANTNPALFSALPAIAPDGTLTYTPAANAHGVATITVQLQDDGGTAHGGSDTSPPQSFTITVTAVNDAPSFMAGPDQTVLEDAGAQSVAGWATAIQAGPADEAGQLLSFVVTANTNPALFSTPPAISPDGTLTYTPAANTHGVATITVQLQDDGGTASGGADTSPPQSFTITVTAVNDAPSFTVGPNQTVLEDAGAQSVAGWATAIQAGPPDEASQRLTFVVTANTNPALFSALPAISPDGTLTYTPAANAHGVATITVQLQDDGGTASGGSDTSPPQSFTITVTEVNDPPVALNDTASTTESAQVIIDVLSNDSDVDGDALSIVDFTEAANGTVIDNGDGTFSYVANAGFSGVDRFTYTISDGRGGTSTGIVDITVNTRRLFGAAHSGGGASTLYRIDAATGAATAIGPIGFHAVSAMDFDASGTLYAIGQRPSDGIAVLITIDLDSGAGTEIGAIVGFEFAQITDMSFRHRDNVLYAYINNDGTHIVATIDLATGRATQLGRSDLLTRGNGIAFSFTDTLFHAGDDILHTLDQQEGAATFVINLGFSPPADDAPRINAMDVHPSTGVLYGSLNDRLVRGPAENHLVTIDTSTGVVTVIGRTVEGLDALAWQSVRATFTVNTDNDVDDGVCDTSHCSLREAINAANAHAGVDIIAFAIAPLGEQRTIFLTSALPSILDPVIIDGTTQGLMTHPPIVLDGTDAGAEVPGLDISAGHSTVRGLVINRFSGHGIVLRDRGGNIISGNYIGLHPVGGTDSAGNGGHGVLISTPNNRIGGTAPEARNVISGNSSAGVFVVGAAGNSIQGNFIGTDASGTQAVANLFSGVVLNNAPLNVVGGTTPGAGNLIAGNQFDAIFIAGPEATGNTVQGNMIGLQIDGVSPLPNGGSGVAIFNGARDNLIGGTAPEARNVISGNSEVGVFVVGAAGNSIQGNFIGTDASGTQAVANFLGVVLENAPQNVVGGTTPGAGNLIAGNQFDAIFIQGPEATGNRVQGNMIGLQIDGVSPLPNGGQGVSVANGARDNLIGGTDSGAGNTIAHNGGAGIIVVESAQGNAILANAIFANTGLGIDLGADGVSFNDPGDADTGPNNTQNFPDVTRVMHLTFGASIVTAIEGALHSVPTTEFRIELFASGFCNAARPFDYGEGERFLAFTLASTDANGDALFSIVVPRVPSGQFLTATATNLSTNDTSEFSQCFRVP